MPDILNVEIKARLANPERVRAKLQSLGADFRGSDLQTDTYFNCPNGRLKLREGNIENSLIYYLRGDVAGPRQSLVKLARVPAGTDLRCVLSGALGVKTEVKKTREIYFIGNVKFHIDIVDGLGGFCEIEAIDDSHAPDREKLLAQCQHYMAELGIRADELIDRSYSDLLDMGPKGTK